MSWRDTLKRLSRLSYVKGARAIFFVTRPVSILQVDCLELVDVFEYCVFTLNTMYNNCLVAGRHEGRVFEGKWLKFPGFMAF